MGLKKCAILCTVCTYHMYAKGLYKMSTDNKLTRDDG